MPTTTQRFVSRVPLLAATLAMTASCLGPQVSDDLAETTLVLPAGSAVPSLYDDAGEAQQIVSNEGVAGVIPLINAFSAGAPAQYWNFGTAPPFATQVFFLMTRDGDGNLVRLPHGPIWRLIPGDPGYSPFAEEIAVEVTALYAGQIIPSTDALDEAQRRGLVNAPVSMKRVANLPVVSPDVQLDPGDGGAPIAATHVFYYEGLAGVYFDFGELGSTVMGPPLTAQDRLVLSREGGAPLSEVLRHVDMDGDGDLTDTNDILAQPPGGADYTPLCRTVAVTVPADTTSIDTSQDQTMVQFNDATTLFAGLPAAPMPLAPHVIAYDVGVELIDCPRRADGVAP